jgi:hypothetical protein
MTAEMKSRLRRSTRTLLEKDGAPGPGPGKIALVMARAGVGKTAFMVGVGLDALLSGQKVLHVTVDRPVEKVRTWYDDLLLEMLKEQHADVSRPAIQLEIERLRHIRTFLGHSFTPERLEEFVTKLGAFADFKPDVIILDRLEMEKPEVRAMVPAIRAIAERAGAEVWMSSRWHREGPPEKPGHLPPPADEIEDLIDLAFLLKHDGTGVRLTLLKDRDRIGRQSMHALLDPTTLLLVPDPAAPSA